VPGKEPVQPKNGLSIQKNCQGQKPDYPFIFHIDKFAEQLLSTRYTVNRVKKGNFGLTWGFLFQNEYFAGIAP
jgi:hypothetical protein